MRSIAGIGEGNGGPSLDSGAPRKITIFDVVVADFDRVLAIGDGSSRSGDCRRRGRGPQRVHLPLEGEGPYGVAIGAAYSLIAAGGDSDILIAVDLVDHGTSLRAKS